MNEDIKWAILFISVTIIFLIFAKIVNYNSTVNYIKAKWGKKPSTDRIKESHENYLKEMFNDLVLFFGNKEIIDNYTYNDLDLYKIFINMDSTFSNIGSSILYHRIRTLDKNQKDQEEFEKIQQYFLENEYERNRVSYFLFTLGKNKEINIFKYIKNLRSNQYEILLYLVMGLVPILSFILFITNIFQVAITFILPSIAINLGYTYYRKNKYEKDYDCSNQLTNLIKVAYKLNKINLPNKEKIKENLLGIKIIRFMSYLSIADSQETGSLAIILFNSTFMVPFIMNSLITMYVSRNKEKIFNLAKNIGDVDSAIAIANYKLYNKNLCDVEFIDEYKIEAKGIYHPLIKDPVKNDVEWEKNILITGSNASGKSTYVKSLAISTIFSQTIYLALADEFKLKKAKVYSSMAIKDDVESGESYFIAEIRSLKRIIDDIENGNNSYYFIDEILKGTNTQERIAASYSIIKYFIEKEILSFVATHDLELIKMFDDKIKNVHFREHFTENGEIAFDYKLYEGASNTKNAIKLLENFKFPQEIIECANMTL